MTPRLVRTALLAFALVLAGPAPAEPPEDWTFLGFDEAMRRAQAENRPIFLYFGRQGCPACEQTNRESFSDAEVQQHYRDHYVLAYVDTESGRRIGLPSGERISEMELGVRFKVFGTPFFYFLEPGGGPILRAPGYQSAQDFLTYDRFINEGHYRSQSLAEFKAGQP